jgi:tRNA U34 2-thiouridine synthase MnmA/TrmU
VEEGGIPMSKEKWKEEAQKYWEKHHNDGNPAYVVQEAYLQACKVRQEEIEKLKDENATLRYTIRMLQMPAESSKFKFKETK